MFASNLFHRDRKQKYVCKFSKIHGGGGKRWPLTPSPFPAPWPCCRPAVETPQRPVHAGPLISWPKNATCSRIPSRASRASLPLQWSDDMLSTHTPPLHCAPGLQSATLSHVFTFDSWTISAPICFNCMPSWFHFTFAESQKPDIWTYVCVFTSSSSAFVFLIKMDYSLESLFAIWSSSPQRFHCYFNFDRKSLCIVELLFVWKLTTG